MAERMRNGRAAQGHRGSGGGAEVLTSRDNRWLKEFRVALRGGVPTAQGAVGVEGVRLVEEALASGCRIEAVLFSESGERHCDRLAPMIGRKEMAFPVLRTTDRLFEGIADTEHPQGVAALVVPKTFALEEVLEGPRSAQGDWGEEEAERRGAEGTEKKRAGMKANATFGASPGVAPLVVVLAGVQDPGNVGTILRTAAAFGATGVVTAATGQSGTASPYAPKAMRASAGAALHLPIVGGMGLGILLTQLKVRGIRSLASCVAEAEGALVPWKVDWRQPVALLVGNEGAGLPEDVVAGADARVHIPMASLRGAGLAQVESLNAAAAAAVVLYEAFRQRKKAVASE